MKCTAQVLLSFLVLVGITARIEASTVVAIWTAKSIVISADSYEFLDATKGSGVRSTTLCRIMKSGETYFAVVGYPRNSQFKYDSYATVRSALAGPGSIESRVEAVKRAMPRELEAFLHRISKAPHYGQVAAALHGQIVQILIATMEGDTPKLFVLAFNAEPGSSTVTLAKTSSCPGDCRQDGSIIEIGHTTAIIQALRSARPDSPLLQGSHVDVAKRLVMLEVKAEPQFVSLPIATVELSATGAKWHDRGVCSITASSSRKKLD